MHPSIHPQKIEVLQMKCPQKCLFIFQKIIKFHATNINDFTVSGFIQDSLELILHLSTDHNVPL